MPTILGRPRREDGDKLVQARAVDRRGSARERGYSARWDRLSDSIRTARPYCEECLRWMRFRFTRIVDHKLPLRAPFNGPLLERSNLWCLCDECHFGLKAWLEAAAEQSGDLQRLALWCDDPATRPAGWQKRRECANVRQEEGTHP
jgi:5-methylcytosine-specific restriction endonuclease McrA